MIEARIAAIDSPRAARDDAPAREPTPLRVQLTNVEFEVLVALSNGLHSKEIAQEQQRSVATIEAYIRVLCGKLNARTRTHLVAQAFRAGVLKSE
jgi:DNA-binding NarL/FixJ family response regulator